MKYRTIIIKKYFSGGNCVDEKVKVSSDDATSDYLVNKITCGDAIGKSISTKPGGEEAINIHLKYDSTYFELNENDELKIKDNLFAPASHTHTKSDITDFNENDYVHTSGDETISGVKRFSDDIISSGYIQGIFKSSGGKTGMGASIIIVDLNSVYHHLVFEDGILVDYYTT